MSTIVSDMGQPLEDGMPDRHHAEEDGAVKIEETVLHSAGKGDVAGAGIAEVRAPWIYNFRTDTYEKVC